MTARERCGRNVEDLPGARSREADHGQPEPQIRWAGMSDLGFWPPARNAEPGHFGPSGPASDPAVVAPSEQGAEARRRNSRQAAPCPRSLPVTAPPRNCAQLHPQFVLFLLLRRSLRGRKDGAGACACPCLHEAATPPLGPLPLPLGGRLAAADVLAAWPSTAPVFARRGRACAGCAMAPFETVADVARTCGLEARALVRDLAQAATARKTKGRVP